MSVQVVNSGPGVIEVSVETTPAITVTSPEVSPVEVTAGLQGETGPQGVTGPQGPAGADGADGTDGADGADGADGTDGADGADGADGQGVPAGGDQYQVLRKASGTDYDTEWDYADRVTLEVRFDEAVSKGDPLYVTGYNNGQNRIAVAKADAADSSKMPSIGLAFSDYSQNDNGQVTTIGSLEDIDTQVANDFQEGDVVYVASGGGLTNVKPAGTNLIQNVGKVGRRQQNNGEIVVMAIGRSNDIPNIQEGYIWAGNSSGVATATDTAYIDIANSRVGIGTTSPTEKLHVSGKIRLNDGGDNVLIGSSWDSITSGINNVALGYTALQQLTTGADNVAVGYRSLESATLANSNTAVGHRALDSVTTGNSNTVLGRAAGAALSIGENNVLIGNSAGATLSSESNKLYINNNSASTPLIYGDFGSSTRRVGIEESSPLSTLHVKDEASIGKNGGDTGRLILRSSVGPTIEFAGNGVVDTTTGGNSAGIRFADTSGYTGKQRYVAFSPGTAGQIQIDRSAHATNRGGLKVQQQDSLNTNGNEIFVTAENTSSIIQSRGFGSTGLGQDIVFKVGGNASNASDTETEVVRITDAASTSPYSVGIGTNAPDEKLHVVGQIKVDDGANPYTFPAADGNPNQVLQTDGSGALTFVDQTTGTDTNIGNSDQTLSAERTIEMGGNSLVFDSSSTEVARIFSQGYIRATGRAIVNGNGSIGGLISLKDADSSNGVTLRCPTTVSSDLTLVLPDADGSSGQVLKTDGGGNLSFGAGPSRGGTYEYSGYATDVTKTATFYYQFPSATATSSSTDMISGFVGQGISHGTYGSNGALTLDGLSSTDSATYSITVKVTTNTTIAIQTLSSVSGQFTPSTQFAFANASEQTITLTQTSPTACLSSAGSQWILGMLVTFFGAGSIDFRVEDLSITVS